MDLVEDLSSFAETILFRFNHRVGSRFVHTADLVCKELVEAPCAGYSSVSHADEAQER